MKPFLILLSLVAGCGTLAAQTRVEDETQDKNVIFRIADKTYPGMETILFNLTQVQNCNTQMGEQKFIARRNGDILLTLRPVDDQSGVGYGFSYRIIPGLIDPKIDTTFVYRMPCSPLKPARVVRGVHVLDKYTKEKGDQRQLGIHFGMEKGDTVYAMRRGVVVKVERAAKPASDAPAVSFTSETTRVRIEHPDGSYAWYMELDGENLFVDEGDEVLPSTPLSLAASFDGERYKTSVQLFWRQTNLDPEKSEKVPFVWRHFFPPFATTDGAVVPEHGREYTPLVNRELVTREMSKKEIKKWETAKK